MKKIKGGITAAKGYLTASVKSGIKIKKLDLCCIYSPFSADTASVFTSNRFKSSSIEYTLKNLKKSKNKSRLILANSGIANTGLGKTGFNDCIEIGNEAANIFHIDKSEILFASTGKIGKRLYLNKIIPKIKVLKQKLSNSTSNETAKAIMTTDTFHKSYAVSITIDNKLINIGGIAKGSGMINPSMATMLCFITTDISISQGLLQKSLNYAVENSFNCITVDGDMSPNDTVFLLANGAAKNRIIKDEKTKSFKLFKQALCRVTLELAKMIVKDGEGATKFITIKVKNPKDKKMGKKVGNFIANSNLFKTAMFGEDFNWGRIISAIGSSGENINMNKLKVYFSNILIYANNTAAKYNNLRINKLIKNKNINITVDLGYSSNLSVNIYTSDLSYDYVKINAEYST